MYKLCHETMLFADEEFSPGTPPPGQERKTTSFQPMLDLQRFQQYVAQEQSKYVENHTAPLLNGRGTDHVPPYSGIAAGQATVPSTVGTKIIGEGSGPFFVGPGLDHVAPHGSSAVGQATIPSTVGTEMNDEGSRLIQAGLGPDHMAPHSGMAVASGHSQPPSFLSHESADTVIAGGPNFVKPGTGKSCCVSAVEYLAVFALVLVSVVHNFINLGIISDLGI